MRGTADYYQLLGVAPNATPAAIKAAYRSLSKRYHPDMGGTQASMAQLNHAYKVLSDRFTRAIYDAERRRRLELELATSSKTSAVPRRHRQSSMHPGVDSAQGVKPRLTWWVRVAWGFAGIVIIIGLLLNLPIEEVIKPAESLTNTPKPLDITYPPDTIAKSPTPDFYTAPDGTAYAAPATSPPLISKNNAPASEPTEAEQDCTATTYKAYGPTQRTICREANGGLDCRIRSLGSQRFGSCNN